MKGSYNTGVVSLMNFGTYVGHDVSFIILSHELGHSFGATVSSAYSAELIEGGDYKILLFFPSQDFIRTPLIKDFLEKISKFIAMKTKVL